MPKYNGDTEDLALCGVGLLTLDHKRAESTQLVRLHGRWLHPHIGIGCGLPCPQAARHTALTYFTSIADRVRVFAVESRKPAIIVEAVTLAAWIGWVYRNDRFGSVLTNGMVCIVLL